jgi:ATP-dependent Clp protease ATP-binding subunit ClpC
MRPEFLNRIDEIVLFRKLDRAQLRAVVGLLLQATEDRVGAQHARLEVAEAAVDWIAEHGYEPEFGARPLRRVIQREVDDRIADLLVTADLGEGDTVRVTVARDGGRLVASVEQAAPALAA